jgi:hypothetical protein
MDAGEFMRRWSRNWAGRQAQASASDGASAQPGQRARLKQGHPRGRWSAKDHQRSADDRPDRGDHDWLRSGSSRGDARDDFPRRSKDSRRITAVSASSTDWSTLPATSWTSGSVGISANAIESVKVKGGIGLRRPSGRRQGPARTAIVQPFGNEHDPRPSSISAGSSIEAYLASWYLPRLGARSANCPET